MKTRALYAGSFDPITRGHLDIINKALSTFDEVHVSIGNNPKKGRLFEIGIAGEAIVVNFMSIMEFFSVESSTRPAIIRPLSGSGFKCTHPDVPVTLHYFNGSITNHAKEIGATHIIRGLRQASDFNDEFSLTGVVNHVDKSLIMTHFICNSEFLHISSSTAKELASLGEDTSWLVTPFVEQALKEKFK